MAIDSVINSYLLVEQSTWEPEENVVTSDLEAGSALPNTRYKGTRYRGTCVCLFPNAAKEAAFLAFWASVYGPAASWTWTAHPKNGAGYSCKFVSRRPGHSQVGPNQHYYSFEVVGVAT